MYGTELNAFYKFEVEVVCELYVTIFFLVSHTKCMRAV